MRRAVIALAALLCAPVAQAEDALPKTKIGPPVFVEDTVKAGAAKAGAAGETVDCPMAKARTEVTSALPAGWWQTPQMGALRDVRLETVGGQVTLMCGYEAYGTTVYVMREAPADRTCSPNTTRTGFTCR